LKNAVLQGFSLKNRKSLQAQAWSKTVRFSAQSISFGTGSNGSRRVCEQTGFASKQVCYANHHR
ncbi:MAG: hypothetical protein LBO04_05595, partial [Spirochaetaceae bacterium]|nr:hypothetical protein [Spirochaetaceae bacterium]